jgi:uncharacterized coiled-coil DUF342 family protein
MMPPDELKKRIEELEQKKSELIEKIRALNKRLRYKEYEKKAFQPFLEQTKDVKIGPLRKEINMLEFKIATQAFTPKQERELLKRLKKLDAEFAKVRDIERARHKSRLIEKDIEAVQKEISVVDEELKKVRGELKKLYEEAHLLAAANKKGIKINADKDEMATLEEICIIEEKKK